jgi:predicted TPR repeat methyltransferase
MKKDQRIDAHDQYAENYDQQVKEYKSYGHDVIFGMCFDYIKPGLKLLDIGIGTGLASEKFAKVGLKIFGLDGSKKMMKVCESKNFTAELKLHNITNLPFPYESNGFDFIISCGVLHFFGELEKIILEVKRLTKTGGIFSFTYANQNEFVPNNKSFIELPTPWEVNIFKHNINHINEILKNKHFEVLKEQKVLLKGGNKEDIEFMVVVSRSN